MDFGSAFNILRKIHFSCYYCPLLVSLLPVFGVTVKEKSREQSDEICFRNQTSILLHKQQWKRKWLINTCDITCHLKRLSPHWRCKIRTQISGVIPNFKLDQSKICLQFQPGFHTHLTQSAEQQGISPTELNKNLERGKK